MSGTPLRVRAAVDRWYVLVVLVLVVLTSLGTWAAYTAHAEPSTHVERRSGPAWETTATTTHAATVTEPNDLYAVGRTLENKSAYFTAIAPNLTGTFTYQYTASGDGRLDARVVSRLVLRSVKRDRAGDVATVYWRTVRRLDTREAVIAPGESLRTAVTVNASALANRTDRIADQLGANPGQVEALVRFEVRLEGVVNDRTVTRTETYALRVLPGDVYRVTGAGAETHTHETTRTVTVPERPGALRSAGGPLLAVASLGGLAGVFVLRRRGALSLTPAEREYLAYVEDRDDFDDWINTIALPDAVRTGPHLEAASLADLVDFAIDTDNSVLTPPDESTYYVRHDGDVYVYDPPDAPDATVRGAVRSVTEAATRRV